MIVIMVMAVLVVMMMMMMVEFLTQTAPETAAPTLRPCEFKTATMAMNEQKIVNVLLLLPLLLLWLVLLYNY